MADYVDQSLYPQPTNPMDNLIRATELGGIASRNKLLQQEVGANAGLQSLYANAPKDANGNIDQNYLLQHAGQAGTRAPEVVQFAQGAQLTAQQIQQQQLATQRAKMSMMAAAVAPLAKPGSTPSDFISSSNDLIQNSNGMITKQDLMPIYGKFAEHLANTPDPDGKGDVTAKYAQQLFGQMVGAGGDMKTGMDLLYGAPTAVHTGGGTTTGTQNPVTGAVTPANYLPDTLPATQTTPDPVTGARNFIGGAGPSIPVPVGSSGAAGSPLAGAFKTNSPAAKAPGEAMSGNSVMSELPPGTSAMLAAAGPSANDRVNQVLDGARQSRISQDVNQQIINLAGNLKDNVGPSKTGWTSLIGKIADMPVVGAPMKAVMDKDPADTTGQLQELQKYLLRAGQIQGQELGLSGTDMQTTLAQHSNPNDAQFPKTIQKLAAYNMALDMAKQGKANALIQNKAAQTDPVANRQFENDFANAVNPNVYRALIASPADRQELYSSLTKQQRQQMVTDFNKLHDMGAIPQQLVNSYQPIPEPTK